MLALILICHVLTLCLSTLYFFNMNHFVTHPKPHAWLCLLSCPMQHAKLLLSSLKFKGFHMVASFSFIPRIILYLSFRDGRMRPVSTLFKSRRGNDLRKYWNDFILVILICFRKVQS